MKKRLVLIIILLAAFLRLYKLGSVPPSLYWDEASLGYNAYSILKTARDEHGRFLPGTNFAAFGDYKPPGYIYATVPSIALFGLNEFAIRFPSALFGILTVLLTYFLAKKLFEEGQNGWQSWKGPRQRAASNFFLKTVPDLKINTSTKVRASTGRKETTDRTHSEPIALLAALFLAISPWHLQFSRGAFEANLGLFFSTLGIYLFIKFATEKSIYIFPSALSFLAGMYTFTGQRLFVPFILIVLVIQFRKQILTHLKVVTVTTVIAGFLFWPLFIFVTGTIEGRLRFNEVTIFKDLEPINISTRYRQHDNFSPLSAIIHNRRFLYLREYLIHYFDAFNPTFLFTRGDGNPRLSVQEVGELYATDLLLILFGIYFLFAKHHKYRLLIIGWLLISPLGPATARETPHALRMIHILPTFQLIAAWGLVSFIRQIRFAKILLTLVALVIIVQFLFYLHTYHFHWPRNYAPEWQYGYKQAVEAIKPLYPQADQIIVTRALGRPYIYFLLYLEFSPHQYWQSAQVVKDRFFFIDVAGFDKFRFTDNVNEVDVSGNVIYVLTPEQIPTGAQVINEIKRPDGQTVFKIAQFTK